MTEPEVVHIEARQLVGMRMRMSLAENKTFELWRGFRPRVHEISNRKGSSFYSLQHYAKEFRMIDFTPMTMFDKWAAVEVGESASIPEGMECITLPAGLYAVFIHRGLPSDFPKTAQYIYGEWLPASPYEYDNRPQFELLGKDYRPDDPNAEEEVWVPVREG